MSSKDKSLLLTVSDLFTEETLKEILRKFSGENEVKILGWDLGEATNKGDSYLSVLSRVKINGEAAGKLTEISLVVKSMPRNLGRRKTFRSTDFFYNEITCYTKIFPRFAEFLKSKGQENLMVVPRCLASLTDGENDFIILEDVSLLGFGPVTRQSTLTLSQSSFILQALAKFHAVSFAFKDQNQEEFQRLAEKLMETYFTPQLYSWYKGFQTLAINAAKDALAREYPGSKGEKCFNSWSGQELYNRSIELCSRIKSQTSVVTQGDSWAPNFLIRKCEDSHIALVLDFQIARCASPATDVIFFIYTCTEKSLRDDHYEELLKLYHDELCKSIRLLGSDPEKLYPWDVFINEIKEHGVHGINSALEAIPGALLDPSEVYDIDNIEGDEAVDIAQIWNIQPLKTKEGRRRLADVIMHAEVEVHVEIFVSISGTNVQTNANYSLPTCTEKSLRDNHYDEMLKLYHNELSMSISLLGSDPKYLYPWNVFIKEVEELSLHGINFALEAVPVSMLPSSEAFEMDVFKENEVVDIATIWNLQPIKSKEGRRRLADVIFDAVEKNYL